LKRIPIRIGVAGGLAKVMPIIGALKGGFINILISDSATAVEVLKRTQD
jgi:dihydroxyacetone kinase-like protein